MERGKIVCLLGVLLQMHDLDSSRHEIFEFGIFENFHKNKEIRLRENSLVSKMYDKKGKSNENVCII